jgi:import inner membrane translocase subunit TIM9
MNALAGNLAEIPMSEKEQRDFSLFITETQLKDSQRTFNQITETCFSACVSSFRSRSLDGGENKCVANCAERYINAVNRAGIRFAEQNEAMQQKQA